MSIFNNLKNTLTLKMYEWELLKYSVLSHLGSVYPAQNAW